MSTDERPNAMRRKAGAGRPPPEIGAPTPAKVLRGSVMQAAEDVVALTVIAGQPEVTRTTIDPMVEHIPEHGLIALLEGPGGRYGLVVLDPQVVAGLIEIQTTGRVVARPAEPRAPTRTDAIMCADFIDRVLEILEVRSADADLAIAPTMNGYRYAMALAETRSIPMTLEDIPYRRFHLSLDLAMGAKTGTMDLLLPFNPPIVGMIAGPGADTGVFSDALGKIVMDTPAVLSGTLHRFDMTLGDIANLTKGSLIPIPNEALGHVAVEDIDGRVVMHGRLGQSGGNRAIRLGGGEAGSDPVAAPARSALAAPSPATPPRMAEIDDIGTLDMGDLPDLEGIGDLGDFGDFASDFPDLGDLGDLGSFGETEKAG